MWHSKWLCYQGMVSMRSLRPQQPGKDKNRAGSMAMWVAPIRMYNHLSRGSFNFLFYSMLSQSGGGCWSQPLVIYIRYTQAKWVVGHVWAGLQDVLVEPIVFLSRDTLAEGGPIPCHVGNPISNKRHAVFDFIIYMWSVRCKRSAIWLFTWCRHYYNIIGFDIKVFWVIVR